MSMRLMSAAVLLGLGLLAGESPGQASKARKVNDLELIKDMRGALGLLRKANHNYEGHRVKAMKQIVEAIEHLGKDAGLKAPNEKFTDGKGGEDQKLSDRQLREAMAQLRTTQRELKDLAATKHRKQAGEHIRQAIRELELALKSR